MRFGHVSKICKSTARCAHCGDSGHSNVIDCPDHDSSPKCVNCNGPHISTSKDCPSRSTQALIHSLAVKNNSSFMTELIRYREAKKKGAHLNFSDFPSLADSPTPDNLFASPTTDVSYSSITRRPSKSSQAKHPSNPLVAIPRNLGCSPNHVNGQLRDNLTSPDGGVPSPSGNEVGLTNSGGNPHPPSLKEIMCCLSECLRSFQYISVHLSNLFPNLNLNNAPPNFSLSSPVSVSQSALPSSSHSPSPSRSTA